MTAIESVTPSEFVDRWLTEGELSGAILLDVREDPELQVASLPFATWIPMAQVPARLGELGRSATIVVMCHGGVRSMQVAQYLASNGFERVANLTGGIDAWSREVDSSIPRY